MGYPDLKCVKGDSGKPIARLTSLGWTCIGNIKNSYECTEYERWYSANKKRILSKSRQAIERNLGDREFGDQWAK